MCALVYELQKPGKGIVSQLSYFPFFLSLYVFATSWNMDQQRGWGDGSITLEQLGVLLQVWIQLAQQVNSNSAVGLIM